ncbi:androglobin isoform X2 [Amia ocellicauda]|uniref:androglobin isoform X2 n=1 Tax=Amia ocellicauda TaxID=2972642 RepID=UPI00346415B2
MSKQQKKRESSSNRVSSSHGQTPNKETSSLTASSSESMNELKKGKFPIWPEWNEADINAEKWEATKGSKDREKSGKSPCVLFFEDPEGKIELPQSLKVHSWKRPSEFILSKAPTVIENESWFDLFSENEHLVSSELMRWIISDICTLWKVCNGNVPSQDKQSSSDSSHLQWKPWEHIYSLCKAVKDHMPLYNVYGKYVVKLYWMGCWRKITVDDTLPFDEKNNMLLPATTCQAELWPMLMVKAIIKLVNTDVHLCQGREVAEFSVLHALTGWLPEVIPLQAGYLDRVWTFLEDTVPKFQLPTDDPSEDKPPLCESSGGNDCRANELKSETPTANRTPDKSNKDKPDVKDSVKTKGKEGEKEKKSLHSARPASELPNVLNQTARESLESPQEPQMIICASYVPLHLREKKISVLGQMADSSEKLRQYGLSHLYSHPVLVNRTRSCPLVAPPKPPPVPRWKLIRQKKQTNPTDEPKEPPVLKPDQFIEIASPFLNYKLYPVKIPLEHSNLASFTETEENYQKDIEDSESVKYSVKSLDAIDTAEVSTGDKKKEDSLSGGQGASGVACVTEPDTASSPGMLQSQEEIVSVKPILQETWIDFEDFCKCFQTLLVFHKPNTYPHQFQKSEFKNLVSAKGSSTVVSSSAPSANATSTPSKQQVSASAAGTQAPDEKGSHFLFVDNLKPAEILISFSALVHWGEAEYDSKEMCKESQKDSSMPQPGLLIAEPFSWKVLSAQPTILQIHTFATKATLLVLPTGRHVLRFTTRYPLGYHIHLCSTVPFVFGDEETVMPNLDRESLSFTEQAMVIMRSIGRVVKNFSDEYELPLALKELELAHCPPNLYGTGMVKSHCKTFSDALYRTITIALGHSLTAKGVMAIRAFTNDLTIATNMKEKKSSPVPESWNNREPTVEEMQAATKLQAVWKGVCVREIRNARKPGTKENADAKVALQEMWSALEPQAEQHAVFLLRYMFINSEKSATLYPCTKDEWTRMSFANYLVSYQDQPPNSWFVVFREVFFVSQDMVVVAKVYSSIPVCILHVVDNDTGEEIPRVFHKVEPYMYRKNQKGYTFMAEAYSGDTPLAAGKWRMRLVGSFFPLPVLNREPSNNNFAIKEFKDYYVPNERNRICRYSVKVTADLCATVQIQTSNPDVYIKLQILDSEEEVASNTGKGHVVIPAFKFFPNDWPTSSTSKCTQIQSHSGGSKREWSTSANSQKSAKLQSLSQAPGDEETTSRPPSTTDLQPGKQVSHKYIVQAVVLQRSWALDDSQLAFVQVLKEMEKNDLKVYGEKQEQSTTPINVEMHTSEGNKSARASTPKSSRKGKDKPAEKSEKDKSGKEKDRPPSRPESQALDVSKPSWILRVVSDSNDADSIDVRKDRERVDEIRAMKQAWETAEPGRSIKAMQSRLQFINKHLQKVNPEVPADGATVSPSPETPSTPTPCDAIQQGRASSQTNRQVPMDFTPFIRKSKPESVLKDESVTAEQERQKSEEIRRFRQMQALAVERREQEQRSRKYLKKQQLEMYEQLQVMLDESRRRILVAREAYRCKLLQAEHRRQEEEAAQGAAHQVELEKPPAAPQKSPKPGKSAGKKK